VGALAPLGELARLWGEALWGEALWERSSFYGYF